VREGDADDVGLAYMLTGRRFGLFHRAGGRGERVTRRGWRKRGR
jgi:hypothetical protein